MGHWRSIPSRSTLEKTRDWGNYSTFSLPAGPDAFRMAMNAYFLVMKDSTSITGLFIAFPVKPITPNFVVQLGGFLGI